MRTVLGMWALFLSVALLISGSGLFTIMVPMRAALEGFSESHIGLLGASYFGGFVLGCCYGGRVIRAVGHIRTFSAMAASFSICALGAALWVDPVWWAGMRGVMGFAFALLAVVIESWLNERSEPRSRASVLSTYMVVNLVAIILGQTLVGVFPLAGGELFTLVAILASLSVIPVALSTAPSPAPPEFAAVHVRQLWTNSPAAFTTCLVVGLTNGSFWALGPRFAQSLGGDEEQTAIFMSAAVLGGAVLQWPIGRLSDLVDRRIVLGMIAAVAAAACFVLLRAPGRFDEGASMVLFLAVGAWGAVAFSAYTVAVALANDHSAPSDFVATSSGLLVLYAAGGVVGPLLSSQLMEWGSPLWLFGAMGAVYVVLLLTLLARIVIRGRVAPEERIEFVDAFAAAQTISQVFDAEVQADLVEHAHELEEEATDAAANADQPAG